MKQTCGAKGVTLLAIRLEVVELLLLMYQERYHLFASWVTPFYNGERALPVQNKEKLQGDIFFLSFP